MRRDRHPLRNLERDPAIPGQPKRLFRFLCEEAGLLEGQNVVGQSVLFTYRELALELGRGRTGIGEWVDPLVQCGVLRVTDENARRGIKRFTILSLHPGDGWNQSAPDPQRQIAFREKEAVAGCRVSSTKPDTSPMDTFKGINLNSSLIPLRNYQGFQGTKGSMGREPERVAAAVAEAAVPRVDDAASVRRNKEELAAWIAQQVGDPDMDPSIPARAADAVVLDDFDLAELETIVRATARKRTANTIHTSPRAYFRGRCIKAGMKRLRYKPTGPQGETP